MMIRIRYALTLVLLVLPWASLPAQGGSDPAPEGKKAVLFDLEGQLSQTMPITLKRAVRRAKEIDAKALIIEIDTPGGEMMLMEQLRDIVFDAHQKEGLDTVAFVDRNADSAGALIAMACQTLYMSPLSHIGSATPVALNPLAPLIPYLPDAAGQPDQDDMMGKIKARARAVFRATAEETGRNPDIAEAMVDPDIELLMVRVDMDEKIMTRQKYYDNRARLGENRVEELFTISPKGELLNMTAREGMEWGFVDGIPESRGELLRDFLDVPQENLVVITENWSEALVNFIESIHFLLLIAGLVLLYVEFQIPGFGIPGILGLTCLALLFFGKWMVGLAEFTEIIMIILGMGLVAVEIFLVPGTFVAGILGALLIGGGILFSFQPFILPDSEAPWETEMLKDNIFHLSLSVVVVFVSIAVLSRFLPKNPLFKRLVLEVNKPGTLHGTAGSLDDVATSLSVAVGDRGVAMSLLRPSGKIRIHGSLIDAQSEGEFIQAEEEVQVVRVAGNNVIVRKVKEDLS